MRQNGGLPLVLSRVHEASLSPELNEWLKGPGLEWGGRLPLSGSAGNLHHDSESLRGVGSALDLRP